MLGNIAWPEHWSHVTHQCWLYSELERAVRRLQEFFWFNSKTRELSCQRSNSIKSRRADCRRFPISHYFVLFILYLVQLQLLPVKRCVESVLNGAVLGLRFFRGHRITVPCNKAAHAFISESWVALIAWSTAAISLTDDLLFIITACLPPAVHRVLRSTSKSESHQIW